MMGAAYSGFLTNTQDIAPNFAGTRYFILGAVHKLRHHLWGEGGVRKKMTL